MDRLFVPAASRLAAACLLALAMLVPLAVAPGAAGLDEAFDCETVTGVP